VSSRSNSQKSAYIVGVTAGIRREDATSRVAAGTAYFHALKNAGLVPVLIPPLLNEHEAAALLDRMDGLLLTGGGDVDPSLYGDSPRHELRRVDPERDRTEIALVHSARQNAVPTLAICRGIQILNVALGGTLVQDIPADWPGALPHDDDVPRDSRSHTIEIEPGSLTAKAVGSTAMPVNSFHHQAVQKLAAGLRVTARSSDGMIEGLEPEDDKWWMIGVQWHPEDLVDDPASPDRGLFAALAERISS
jgi:putative glutamine amidotransferase